MATVHSTIGPKANQSDCPILGLPEETLSSILNLAIGTNGSVTSQLVRLSRTCQRFRSTLIPKLYSELPISLELQAFSYDDPSSGFSNILEWSVGQRDVCNPLKDNPELGRHCKTLKITIADISTTTRSLNAWDKVRLTQTTSDFIGRFSNITDLKIFTSYRLVHFRYEKAMAMFTKAALIGFPNLKSLIFLRLRLDLSLIIDGLVDIGKHNTNLTLRRVENRMNRATRYALKSFEGTAPFTNLNIHESFLDLESLDALLTWPKNLQKLRLGYDMPMTEEWTFSHVQPMLETQMASLRELTITPAQDFGDIWNLDLTGFVKLEVLGLPSFVTGCDTVYIPSILAPNLRVFNWDFAYRSDSYVAVEDYDQAQEEWVDAMVDLAITRQKNLREIYINFRPIGYRSLRKVEGFVYPWDRLDESARVASKFGIRIRYNEPNVSREAFEKWEM